VVVCRVAGFLVLRDLVMDRSSAQTYSSAFNLHSPKAPNLQIPVNCDSRLYVRYTDPQNTCKYPRRAARVVVDIAARRGARGVEWGAQSRNLARLWRMMIGVRQRAERRWRRGSRG
jgi:hypothetical protein